MNNYQQKKGKQKRNTLKSFHSCCCIRVCSEQHKSFVLLGDLLLWRHSTGASRTLGAKQINQFSANWADIDELINFQFNYFSIGHKPLKLKIFKNMIILTKSAFHHQFPSLSYF